MVGKEIMKSAGPISAKPSPKEAGLKCSLSQMLSHKAANNNNVNKIARNPPENDVAIVLRDR